MRTTWVCVLFDKGDADTQRDSDYKVLFTSDDRKRAYAGMLRAAEDFAKEQAALDRDDQAKAAEEDIAAGDEPGEVLGLQELVEVHRAYWGPIELAIGKMTAVYAGPDHDVVLDCRPVEVL